MLNRSSLLLASVISAFAAWSPPALYRSAPTIQVNASKKQRRRLLSGSLYSVAEPRWHKAAGISMAQQKRAAKKVRNVRRHKLAAKRG